MLAHLLLSLAAAGTSFASPLLEPRGACGEASHRICYSVAGATPQNLDVEDIKYAASWLRHLAKENPSSLYTMPKPTGFSCQEWTIEIPDSGSMLVLAKQNSARYGASVLFSDFANAIDGGENASQDAIDKSLLGCGSSGGQVAVRPDRNNPAYNTAEYRNSNAKPDAIVLKLVKAPQ